MDRKKLESLRLAPFVIIVVVVILAVVAAVVSMWPRSDDDPDVPADVSASLSKDEWSPYGDGADLVPDADGGAPTGLGVAGTPDDMGGDESDSDEKGLALFNSMLTGLALPEASESVSFVDGVVAPGPDPTMTERVIVPSLCAEQGELVSTAQSPGVSRATWSVPVEIEEAVKALVEEMQAQGFTMQFGGVLDLFMLTWGGVVVSEEGWVELVLGDARGWPAKKEEDGTVTNGCYISIIRLDEGVAQGLRFSEAQSS